MENSCQKLLTTYNASTLEDANSLTQALFYHHSSNNVRGDKGNTVLMELIANYYLHKSIQKDHHPIMTKIGGPISLTLQWSDTYKMYVYIFGEYHASNTDCDIGNSFNIKNLRNGCGAKKIRNPVTKRCVNQDGPKGQEIIRQAKIDHSKVDSIKVENFLLGLFQYTPAFIDFYLETPGYTGQDYKKGIHPWMYGGNRLAQLSTTFYDCLSAAKRKHNSLCKLVRVHYIDIRKEEGMVDVNDVSHLRHVFHQISYLSLMEQKNILKNDERIVKTIKKLVTTDTEEYKKFWKKQLLQSSILKKEFSRTLLSEDIILSFLEEEIIKEAMRYREYFQFYLATFDSANMNINHIMHGISFTVAINGIVVDMYTISRMFKKFKNVKNQPERPRNIILYAGDAHSTKCRKFFKYLGFQTITETNGIPYDYQENNKYDKNSPRYYNCVDISKFKQPFFSEYPPTK